MKQTLLIILVFFSLFQLSAQVTLVLGDASSFAEGTKDDSEIIAKTTIKNNTSEKKRILWSREVLSLTEGWGTAFCDKNICYDPSIDNFEFELDSLEEAEISVYGYPRGIEGAASVAITLTDASDAANTVTGQFEVQSDGFTTSTRFISNPDIKIYPNPTSRFFSLTDATDVERLSVYNIVGRAVKTFPVNSLNQYDIADLPVGMYLVRLANEYDQTLKAVRLQVSYP